MYEITITVCEQAEAEDILEALSNAEEEGVINFPFQCKTREMSESETDDWKTKTFISVVERAGKFDV